MTNATHDKAKAAGRVLLGLMFTVFGLNGFVGFLPQPPYAGEAGAFIGALAASGYMFPLIKATELVTGVMLLANRYVPLALTLLAPVVINIVAFHVFLDPGGLVVPLVTVALGVYLAWSERAAYAPLFAARSPARAERSERGGGHAASPA